MNEPIDILRIAERLFAEALYGWQINRANFDPRGIFVPATATAALDAARDDLWRARALANDVTLVGG